MNRVVVMVGGDAAGSGGDWSCRSLPLDEREMDETTEGSNPTPDTQRPMLNNRRARVCSRRVRRLVVVVGGWYRTATP